MDMSFWRFARKEAEAAFAESRGCHGVILALNIQARKRIEWVVTVNS